MFREALALATTALARSALRSALTALGIVIGVASVVAMVTIGRGTTERVTEEIRKLGTQLITIRLGQEARAGTGARVDAKPFDYDDVEAIRQQVRGIKIAAPLSFQTVRVVARRANWAAVVIGTENEFIEARRWRLDSGRLFTGHEIYSGKNVCIIGSTVREKLFGPADPLGEIVRIQSIPCEVIGVLKSRGQTGLSQDDDNMVVMPIYGFQRRIQGTPDIQSMVALAHENVDTVRVKQQVEGLLRERRGIGFGQGDNFHVLEMRQVAEATAGASRVLTSLLAAIAAVSLLVGGIGVMNIMLVSVTERTTEIGIRLAIGALPSQVRTQFLLEAVILALFGGVLGIGAGLGIAAAARIWLPVPFVLDPVIIVVAFLTSAGIGVMFGWIPAVRAARLDPIRALRNPS
jgi:putative ABC transport system permease protein